MHLQGHARDLLTWADGGTVILAEDRIDVRATPMRELLHIAATPPRPDVSALVGKRAGGHLRAAINELFPDERAAGSPFFLLLDDLAGASLVAGWAWSRWTDDWMTRIKRDGTQSTAGRGGQMLGICTGFAPGSSALGSDGAAASGQSSAPVPPLENPDDALGWHALPPQQGVGMRRARRIDIWPQDGKLQIDAGFQDSATSPEGGRVAVHEYGLTASANLQTGRLVELHAEPRVLPYRECPGAAPNVQRLVGEELSTLRFTVLKLLAATLGCTHLNDALRALAEVPQLVREGRKQGLLF